MRRFLGTASSQRIPGQVFWRKDVGDVVRPSDEILVLEQEKMCVSVTGEMVGLKKDAILSRRLVSEGGFMGDEVTDEQEDWFEYDSVIFESEPNNVQKLTEADMNRKIDFTAEYSFRLLLEGSPERALKEVLEVEPINTDTRLLLRCIATRMTGDVEKALDLLSSPSPLPLLLAYEKTNLLLLLGRLDEAKDILRNSLLPMCERGRNEHMWVNMAYSLACIALAQGSVKEAQDLLEMSLTKQGLSHADKIFRRVQSILHQIVDAEKNAVDAKRFVLKKCNAPILSCVNTNDLTAPKTFFSSARKHVRPIVRKSQSGISPVQLAQLLHHSQYAVCVTGSGLSVESGLRTRQDLWNDPLWNRDKCVSVSGFHQSPEDLWKLVQSFLSDVPNYVPEPNRNHHMLASLEVAGVLNGGIITQNVDELHQRAGSKRVIELHGSLNRVVCNGCGQFHGTSAAHWLVANVLPPQCPLCRHVLRPDVVLFGEMVPRPHYEAASNLLSRSDLVLVLGTACDVAPTSDLINLANNAVLFELALEPTLNHPSTHYGFYGNGKQCGDFLQQTLKEVQQLITMGQSKNTIN